MSSVSVTKAAARNYLARRGVPEGGSLVDFTLNEQSFRCGVLPGPGGAYKVQGSSYSLDVTPSLEGYIVTGSCADGTVELVAERLGDITNVVGWVGNRMVRLSSSRWEGTSEHSIRGSLGGDNVFLTQHPQVDGNLVTGYVGPKRLSFREREIPGEGPDLDPVVYLPAILPSQTCCAPGRVNVVV